MYENPRGTVVPLPPASEAHIWIKGYRYQNSNLKEHQSEQRLQEISISKNWPFALIHFSIIKIYLFIKVNDA